MFVLSKTQGLLRTWRLRRLLVGSASPSPDVPPPRSTVKDSAKSSSHSSTSHHVLGENMALSTYLI